MAQATPRGLLVGMERILYVSTHAHVLSTPTSLMRTFCLVGCLLLAGLLPSTLQAQTPTFSLYGQVTDAETGDPLPGAHVFIANSERGDITDADGRYALEGIPVGAHRIYSSSIGYEPVAVDTLLREARPHLLNLALAPSTIVLGEVTVEAERDRRWKRRFDRFVKLFIGETPNAMKTTIENPEVLDFDNEGGALVATASEPLIITNKALGYRIQYFLKDFRATATRVQYDGEPLYEELDPTSPEEAARWEERRRTSFMGSPRHFLLALMAERTEEQGFLVFSRPVPGGMQGLTATTGLQSGLQGNQRFPLDPSSLLQPSGVPGEWILEFDSLVELVYRGETEDEAFLAWNERIVNSRPRFQTSQMWQERGSTVLDYKGDTLDPYGITVSGYWAFERVADDVPKEYRPN